MLGENFIQENKKTRILVFLFLFRFTESLGKGFQNYRR